MTGRRGSGFRAAVLVLVVVGLSATAQARDVLGEIVARAATSPLAVVGEPLRQESRWEEGGIWTYTEIAVRRSLGESVPATLLVRERGGVVGSVGQRVTHSTHIDPARPHLLLLWRDPETGSWQPGVGGALPLTRDATGEERIDGLPIESVLHALQAVVR